MTSPSNHSLVPRRRIRVMVCSLAFALAVWMPARPGSVAAEPGSSSSDSKVTRSRKRAPAAVNWRLEKTTGDRPSPRGAGKLVPIGNKLVLIGGFRECFDKDKCEHEYFDQVYTLDLKTNRWQKKKPISKSGEFKGRRIFFGAAPYKKRNTVVIFGGSEYNAKTTSVQMYDDLWEYDPVKETLERRVYTNPGPVPRLGGEIVIKGDTLYLFGGYDGTFKAHNELWSYDLLSNTWKRLKADDDPNSPSKRYIFRFELSASGDDIFIFGGNYREKYTIQRNDTWKYNIDADTFSPLVSEDQTNISGRTHGAWGVTNDKLVIALGDIPNGGCFTNQASEHQNPTNEVWTLGLDQSGSPPLWKPVKIGFGPPPIKRVMYAQSGGRLYVVGGFNFKCDKPGSEEAIYNSNTYSLPLVQIK